MRKIDLRSAIVNGILAIGMGMAVAGCLTTAFHLQTVLGLVFFCCVFWAILSCVVIQLQRGWIAMIVALALWWLLLWATEAEYAFGFLLRTIFTIYSRGYGFQIPSGLLEYIDPNVTSAIALISGITTLLAGLSLTRLRSGTLAVTACALPVLPCLVVTDTVPHAFFLFLLLNCIVLTILSQNTRRHDPKQASRLTAVLMVPVLLANIWLFQANPQQSYDKQPENKFVDLLAQWFEPFIGPVKPPDVTINTNLSLGDVDLRTVGPKKETKDLAIEVVTDLEGVLYLRGKSYSDYDGLSWTAPSIGDDALQILHPFYLQSALSDDGYAFLDIHTVNAEPFQYAAYYPARKVVLQGGAFSNPFLEKQYSMSVDPLRTDWLIQYKTLNPDLTLSEMKLRSDLPGQFLGLPQWTLTQAKKILQENGITNNLHVQIAVASIAKMVKTSARYSLDTPFMPTGEKDFVLWFLEHGETGYCIHFATAATVLLRAAGIPARYVEGYVTQVSSDGTARVTEDQAHAWVEYYLPNLGWVMLEPTPDEGWQPPLETSRPTQPVTSTQPTAPSVTRPPQTVTSQPQTTVPSSSITSTTPGTDTPDMPKVDLSWLWALLQGLLLLILAAAVVICQWRLRLYLRNKWLHGGTSNTQTLRCWRYAKHLAKLRRQDAPAALKTLAQKAKFSQHTISAEELAAFDGYFDRSIAHLRSRSLPMRLIYRLIFAAY